MLDYIKFNKFYEMKDSNAQVTPLNSWWLHNVAFNKVFFFFKKKKYKASKISHVNGIKKKLLSSGVTPTSGKFPLFFGVLCPFTGSKKKLKGSNSR